MHSWKPYQTTRCLKYFPESCYGCLEYHCRLLALRQSAFEFRLCVGLLEMGDRRCSTECLTLMWVSVRATLTSDHNDEAETAFVVSSLPDRTVAIILLGREASESNLLYRSHQIRVDLKSLSSVWVLQVLVVAVGPLLLLCWYRCWYCWRWILLSNSPRVFFHL